MKRKDCLLRVPVLLLVLIATAAYAAGWGVITPNRPLETEDLMDLKVHEWGTFTSIAGQNGEVISWRPFGGPTDLPCFVDRFRTFKGDIVGTVRMETPVLYFYGSRESTANVRVLFPQGVITEWYPNAMVSRLNNALEWRVVKVSPDAQSDFPVEPGQSHYYAARKTDAAPLRVGPQKEKFLFYRGVGSFSLPISAKVVDGGNVLVKNLDGDPVSGVVLFENRGGRLRYQIACILRDEVKLHLEPLDSNRMALESDLERILVREGLFLKEARAMLETWRDSWFEEGTRLFYITPKSAMDSILPLDIQPAPAQIARVFVGRIEIVTPAIEDDVKQAVAAGDLPTLEKYGRFLEPIAKRIAVKSPLLNSVYSAYVSHAAGCN